MWCCFRVASQSYDSCRCLSIYYVHIMYDVTICLAKLLSMVREYVVHHKTCGTQTFIILLFLVLLFNDLFNYKFKFILKSI